MSGGGGAPRIAPLAKAELGDDETAALRAYLGDAGLARFLSDDAEAPPLPNVLGTLVRHPALATRFLPYNDVLLRKGSIDPRVRELAILRVAWRTGSEYEWVQHVRLARGLDVTDAEIDAIAGTGVADHDWSPLEATVLAATDELLAGYRVTDATWARLAEHLASHQLVELVFVVGTYVCLSMAFQSFGIELDPELVGYPAPAVPRRGT